VCHLTDIVTDRRGDICDHQTLEASIAGDSPEIIFHLAAQPIVSASYDDPRATFNTNVIGTLNVLEAARKNSATRAVVCVTTDKVYANNEWHWGYRENDPLGGKDPYSASKSAAEMVVHTYQHAFSTNNTLIASARGGNIIGGGDWARDRIVPDFVRAAGTGRPLILRDPSATRPWQHVLALIHGYLLLGERLLAGDRTVVDGWNFGPSDDGERDVGTLVGYLEKTWPSVSIKVGDRPFSESHFLHLNSEKSRKILGWKPPLDFDESVTWTGEWYRSFYETPSLARRVTLEQIEAYRDRLR
jgi:CDP-glucose 4,6-dehydratase